MKTPGIKIIKRKSPIEVDSPAPRKLPRLHLPMTVTATVNDWIAESRKNRLAMDNSSRNTIAGWTAEA